MSEKVPDHVGSVVEALINAIGLDPTEVLDLRVDPAAGEIAVTVLDAYRNVRALRFHYAC